jgi:CheY-like chemotaxis protein
VPVVVVSVLGDETIGLSLGATAILPKPVDRERLVAMLHKVTRRPATVLVVEDDAASRELVRRVLEEQGCRVLVAEDGKRAIAVMEQETPDLLILDLMMPEMDGFEVIERLRAHPPWAKVPVVVTTAKDLTADDRRRLNGHVQEVMKKGAYDRDGVVGWLRTLVGASNGGGRAGGAA